MTRPIGFLIVLTTLCGACLPGCAQWAWQREADEAPMHTFRPPRSQTATFSTCSEDRPSLEPVPTSSKKLATVEVEPKKPPLLSTLPRPPVAEDSKNSPAKSAPAPPTDLAVTKPTPSTTGGPLKAAPPPPDSSEAFPSPLPRGEPAAQVTPPPGTQASKEPLVEALIGLLENRATDVPEMLKKYDPATQDLLVRILPTLALLTQKKVQDLDSAEIALLNSQLTNLLARVRPRTELVIDKACFCEWVKSFGNYQPLPEDHVFAASAPARPGERVHLYAEVKNFASEIRDGLFVTRFSSSVEIHDANNEKIWSHRFDDRQYPIRSRSCLQDYFNNYSFSVPHLPAGVYTLTIHIADETIPDRRREASKRLEFRIGAALR